MNESYLFHVRIAKSWCPNQVWTSVFPVIQRFSRKVSDVYNISCGSPNFSGKASPTEISEILRRHNDGSYLITWRNNQIQTNHSFTYFERDKDLSFRFSAELISKPLDAFGREIADVIPLANMVVQANSYMDSFSEEDWNPGRNNLFLAPCYNNGRDGYIEGVGAEMWFGDTFWQYAKCTLEDVLKQDWLHCEERPSHLYVRAWPEPFSSAEGEQGAIQRRLLDLLFGINGKTPPPLPPPAQSTFVQKVLVDGNNVHDLGMEKVRSDGSRMAISPPEPPTAP